jgi:hypothetical protein
MADERHSPTNSTRLTLSNSVAQLEIFDFRLLGSVLRCKFYVVKLIERILKRGARTRKRSILEDNFEAVRPVSDLVKQLLKEES